MSNEVFRYKNTRFYPTTIRHLGGHAYLVALPYDRNGKKFVYLRYESEHLAEPLARIVERTAIRDLPGLLRERSDEEIQQATRVLQRQARQQRPTTFMVYMSQFPEQLDLDPGSMDIIRKKIQILKKIIQQRQRQQYVQIEPQALPTVRWLQAVQELKPTQGVSTIQQYFGGGGDNSSGGGGGGGTTERRSSPIDWDQISAQEEMVRHLKKKITDTPNPQEKAVLKKMLQDLQSARHRSEPSGTVEQQQQDWGTAQHVTEDQPVLRLCVYLSDKPPSDEYFRESPLFSFKIPLENQLHHPFLAAHTHLTDVLQLAFSIFFNNTPISTAQKTGVRAFLETVRTIAPFQQMVGYVLWALYVPAFSFRGFTLNPLSDLRALGQGMTPSNMPVLKRFFGNRPERIIWLMKYAKGVLFALFDA